MIRTTKFHLFGNTSESLNSFSINVWEKRNLDMWIIVFEKRISSPKYWVEIWCKMGCFCAYGQYDEVRIKIACFRWYGRVMPVKNLPETSSRQLPARIHDFGFEARSWEGHRMGANRRYSWEVGNTMKCVYQGILLVSKRLFSEKYSNCIESKQPYL